MNWDYTPSAEDAKELREGARRLTEGSFHGIIEELFEDKDKDDNDMLVVETNTLAGTTKDCKGVKHSFFFTQNEWAIKDLIRLLFAVELCTQQQVDDAAASNAPLRIGSLIGDLKGKQLCYTLKKNKKGFLRATYFNVNSEEAKDIPKDFAAAELAKSQADADANDCF